MDRNWVASILKGACGHANVPSEEFIDGVLSGLEIGAKQYGEHAYLGRNNTKEGRYEARDAAAYALMEMADMQDAYQRGEISEHAVSQAQQHLLNVIVLAAQTDYLFSLARKARLG